VVSRIASTMLARVTVTFQAKAAAQYVAKPEKMANR
jgi:hypothetical protein